MCNCCTLSRRIPHPVTRFIPVKVIRNLFLAVRSDHFHELYYKHLRRQRGKGGDARKCERGLCCRSQFWFINIWKPVGKCISSLRQGLIKEQFNLSPSLRPQHEFPDSDGACAGSKNPHQPLVSPHPPPFCRTPLGPALFSILGKERKQKTPVPVKAVARSRH